MKIVNKYILASCIFCYFAGIYLIAAKFGIMRLISRYGMSRAFDEWPADFPSLNLVYISLAAYTVFFVIITYVIYKNIESHGQEMDLLQQKASTLHNYSEDFALIVSRYNRICKEKNISNINQSQRMKLLEKKISSLPTSVLNNSSASGKIARIVSELDDAVSKIEAAIDDNVAAINVQIGNIIECAIDDVQRLKK